MCFSCRYEMLWCLNLRNVEFWMKRRDKGPGKRINLPPSIPSPILCLLCKDLPVYSHLARTMDIDDETEKRKAEAQILRKRQNICRAAITFDVSLIEWIQYLPIGHAVDKKTIRPKVESILEGDKKRRPSRAWIHYVIKRHPELKLA